MQPLKWGAAICSSILGLVILVGAFLASGPFTLTPGSVAPSSCSIKDNISIATGERIYHIPGHAYYSATRISLAHGERWFCSEVEAQAVRWRKSKV
ncbi:hypothetical protein AB4Z52_09270 [Rhizobium sp. 2YAF20]